jgi:hypothetical protein
VSGIRQGASDNPGANTPAGGLFAAAGSDFELTLGAYRHSAAADTDDDGVPDAAASFALTSAGGLAPSFAASASLSAVAPFAPAAGGALSNAGAIAMTGGAANPTNLNFTEVGSFTLSTANVVTAYLGTAGLNLGATVFDAAGAQTTAAPVVGRFRPAHFAIAGTPTLTNRLAAACAPASGFSYLDEGLRLEFTLQARNALDAVTQNYAGAWAKLDPTLFASFALGARSGATDLSARIDSGLAPAGAWSGGAAAVSLTTAITRATPDLPDGPYPGLQFGIAPVDADGVAMNVLDLDVDNDATAERKSVGPVTEVRYGRLRLENVVGSEHIVMRVPVSAQYWSGTAFATNPLDSCTTLARANVALEFTGAIAPCDTAITQASVTFASGTASFTLAAPGTGNNGSVVLTPQLGSPASGSYCPSVGGAFSATTAAGLGYLTGRWDAADDHDSDPATSYDDDPFAHGAFGVYGAQPRYFIFFRENY